MSCSVRFQFLTDPFTKPEITTNPRTRTLMQVNTLFTRADSFTPKAKSPGEEMAQVRYFSTSSRCLGLADTAQLCSCCALPNLSHLVPSQTKQLRINSSRSRMSTPAQTLLLQNVTHLPTQQTHVDRVPGKVLC